MLKNPQAALFGVKNRRNLRASAAPILLACGVLVSATVDRGASVSHPSSGPYSAFDTPTFVAELSRGRLVLSVTTESGDHESGLLSIVADQLGEYEAQIEFVPGIVLSDDWAPATMRLLYALASTQSVRATMQDQRVELRGVTFDAATLHARIDFLRTAMPTNSAINMDITVVQSTATLAALCHRTFASLAEDPVAFRQSSAEIRTSSYSVLDKIIDFAYDCRDMTIAITGHSDASGDELTNQRLSQARAQSVADFLMRGGVAVDRLLVEGHGSSTPIADNATSHGRSLNRRIAFELRPASL